jgi:CRP-like cAMP-binding protein
VAVNEGDLATAWISGEMSEDGPEWSLHSKDERARARAQADQRTVSAMLLVESAPFRHLTLIDALTVYDFARRKAVQAGLVIFHENYVDSLSDATFIVLSGMVRLEVCGPGRLPVCVQRQVPGGLFGGLGLLGESRPVTSAVAEVGSTLLILDRESYNRLGTSQPRVLHQLKAAAVQGMLALMRDIVRGLEAASA